MEKEKSKKEELTDISKMLRTFYFKTLMTNSWQYIVHTHINLLRAPEGDSNLRVPSMASSHGAEKNSSKSLSDFFKETKWRVNAEHGFKKTFLPRNRICP